MRYRDLRCVVLAVVGFSCAVLHAQAPGQRKEGKNLNDKVKEIAGSAEFLRSVPKPRFS